MKFSKEVRNVLYPASARIVATMKITSRPTTRAVRDATTFWKVLRTLSRASIPV